MRKHYDVVIVGGGIQGLSLAYYLARDSSQRVVVFEKGYLGSGASGRNGEMIRSAFGSRQWIGLWNKSLQLWENLAAELGFNVMFTRHGYIILATKLEEFDALKQNQKTQRELGLTTTLLDAEEVMRLIPAMNPEVIAGGLLQAQGGFARHDAAIWGYAQAARRLGVDIFPSTEVMDIGIKSGRVQSVKTSGGEVETRTVVNTAGAHDQRISKMAGIELPTEAHRIEIMVTEPIKPFLAKAVSAPGLLCYMHQSARGEFIGGAEKDDFVPSTSMKNSLGTTCAIAGKYIRIFPQLAGVRMMRQWTGLVSQTPDHAPIIGPVPEIEGFILSVAWGGYGFMGGPGGGKALSEYIITGDVPPEIRPFNADRFETGKLVIEPAIIRKEH
ncbi:MAG: FAD-dependent oxidoreductase [Desulfobacterales bacterium]|jgi:sarcosine oxidase subunit beta